MNTKLLINGKLVAGKGAKEDVLDPATAKPLVVDRGGVARADRECGGRCGQGVSRPGAPPCPRIAPRCC